MAKKKSALGRGLSSLIPEKKKTASDPAAGSTAKASAEGTSTTGREVLEIPTDKIDVNPHQPRKHFSSKDLEDLLNSIEKHGILQPLVVTTRDGEYELVAGERRLRAARTLGLATVPVIVRNASDQEKLELALIENIQRQDLNPVEEAIAYRALIDEFDLTQAQVAERVGKSRSTVANILRLLDLSDDMLEALKDGRITKSHARTLLSEADPEKRRKLFAQMLEGKMTVREAESKTTSRTRKKTSKKDPNLRGHEKTLQEIFDTKVEIKKRGDKGTVSITFYSDEELKALLKKLTTIE